MEHNLEEVAEMSGACFYNILRATWEVDSTEPRLDIIGRREIENNKIVFRLINSYPIQTAKRKPTEVIYGNYAARERLVEMNNALVKLGSKYKIIGQCHHHVHAKRREVDFVPGEEDINAIKTEMKNLKLRYYYIELIGEIKRHKYKEEQEICLNISKKEKGLSTLFNFSKKRGIEICLRVFKAVKRKEETFVEKELGLYLVKPIIEARKLITELNNLNHNNHNKI